MLFDEFINKYNIKLNDQQKAACQSVDQPTLLLAVPGSGKTTTLVARLGWMIYGLGIEPENILTVTYTVAATKDMKERFIKVFGDDLSSRIEFRTINGICAKVISRYGAKIGKTPFGLLTDEGERSKIIAGIYLKKFNEYPEESDIKGYLTAITYIKNMLLNHAEIEQYGEKNDIKALKDVFSAYQAYLKENKLMDYDDQMVYTHSILKSDPNELLSLCEQFKYICVDEAQDTSKIQHMIISLIAKKYQKLFMVGDEDQSIYGFRAAYPQALLDFEKTYTNAKVLLMEENFRSTREIVEVADKFIQRNRFRHAKNIKPSRDNGDNIEYISVVSAEDEYNKLLARARDIKSQTAFLYRDNEMIIPMIDLFERNNISYRIKGGDFIFFSHKIVKDVTDIINWIHEPNNFDLFSRVYYKLETYLSKAELIEAKQRMALDSRLNIFQALRLSCADSKIKRINEIASLISSLSKGTALQGMRGIEYSLRYGEYMKKNHLPENKLEILKSLARRVDSLKGLLVRLNEIKTILENKKPDYSSNLILSTIHSSKGLEYDTVYLMDEKTGLFPVTDSCDYKDKTEAMEYEEERRLFYVGITRAKNHLKLIEFGSQSPFVKELKVKQPKPIIKTSPQPKVKAYSKAYNETLSKIKETRIVKHNQYGVGKVLDIKDNIATIEFKSRTGKFSLEALISNRLIEVI